MKRRMKKRILLAATAVFMAAAVIAGILLAMHYLDDRRHTQDFDELAGFVTGYVAPIPTQDEEVVDARMQAYLELYAQNPDFIGWLYIEGTSIDYPVMYTPAEPEYYLYRDFNREQSDRGTPFLAASCDPYRPSDNLIIYGHHMNNGKMFGVLMEYASKSYWEAHPVIHFDTLQGYGEYEVVAVFKTSVYTSNPDQFQYYNYTDFTTESLFHVFMAQVHSRSLYDTGIEPVYGDQLLTLSTCEYSQENGRLVVLARRLAVAGED